MHCVFKSCRLRRQRKRRQRKSGNKSVSLPEKLDGSVIKILAYDGWEQEHADIRKQLKDWYGASVEYTVVDNKDMKNKLAVDLAANITYDMMPMSADLILNNLATPITKYVDLNEDIFKDYKKIGRFCNLQRRGLRYAERTEYGSYNLQ